MTSTRDHACDQERSPIALPALAEAIATLRADASAMQTQAVRLHQLMLKTQVVFDNIARHVASGALPETLPATGPQNVAPLRLNPHEITLALTPEQFETLEAAASDLFARNADLDIDDALVKLLLLGCANYNIARAITQPEAQ